MKKVAGIAVLGLAVFVFVICPAAPAFAVGAGFTPYSDAQAEVEPYFGKVRHIFFHSLILYPQLAFSGADAQGYKDWMVTRREFKEILHRLYRNGYALVDIRLVYQAGGKGFLFPKGKKPLIISVDDVNYYESMKNKGFAQKLIVDQNERLAALVKTPDGGVMVDYEGDIAPIIENFVKLHPDFSYNQAKGVLAVTGYQGVFGYRITSLKGNELEQELNEAKRVADWLKNSGWKIACHSYGHSPKFKDGSITIDRLKSDMEKWNGRIAPVTGKTDIFIPPYGRHFASGDSRFKLLRQNGFNIFCPVYKKMETVFSNGYMVSQRLNIDGLTLTKYPSRMDGLFDIDGVIDPAREQGRAG